MYLFLFFLLCSPAFCLGQGIESAECPSLLIYDEAATKLYESNLLTNQHLVLKVGLSIVHGLSENAATAYHSLGLTPRLQWCSFDGGSLTNLTITWSQSAVLWTITTDTTGCEFECCVRILLDTINSGCGVLEWVGYFLGVGQSPLLQWLSQIHPRHSLTLSTSLSPLTLIRHLQCSLQVAVVVADNELTYTTSSFNQATDVSYSICSLAGLSTTTECMNFVVIDVALAHKALLLLTSAGLYISDTVSGQLVRQDVPFIVQGAHFLEQNSLFCQDLVLSNEILRVISLSANSVLVNSALPPYTNWTALPQSTICSGGCNQLLAAYDSQINQILTAFVGDDSLVHTSSDVLLGNVSLSHMFYHLTSSSVYIFGSKVWISVDEGETFTTLLELPSPVISYSHNDQALILLTASGQMYLSRPGSLLPTLLKPLSTYSNLTTYNLTRISLGKSNTFWEINLINKTSKPLRIKAEELDVWDIVELKVMASTAESQRLPRHFLDITVTLGHPELFDILTMSQYTSTTHILTALIWQKNTTYFPVHSSLRLSLVYCSSLCDNCALITLLRTSCPTGKQLEFIYPSNQSGSQRYTLPINYRPPSALGVAIHSSPHVYNADPTTLTQSPFSDVSAQLKQCLQKNSRSKCECTENQYTTSDITSSDCIRAVYRQLYEVVFPLSFSLLLAVDGLRSNATYIELEELNYRSDFTIITNNSQVSAIRFKGPGLFHFRALLVNITTFCQLSTQFTVFVERTPLPKAWELTVTTLTTIVFGLLTFIGYLIHRKYKQKYN